MNSVTRKKSVETAGMLMFMDKKTHLEKMISLSEALTLFFGITEPDMRV